MPARLTLVALGFQTLSKAVLPDCRRWAAKNSMLHRGAGFGPQAKTQISSLAPQPPRASIQTPTFFHAAGTDSRQWLPGGRGSAACRTPRKEGQLQRQQHHARSQPTPSATGASRNVLRCAIMPGTECRTVTFLLVIC